MKTPVKILACIFAAGFVFLSCDFGTNSGTALAPSSLVPKECPIAIEPNPSPIDTSGGEWVCTESIPGECYFIRPSIKEMPIMDCRVAAYAKIEDNSGNMTSKFISDPNLLKSWFPNVFNREQTEECDYFALVNYGSNYSYGVLAYNHYTEFYDQVVVYPGECSEEIIEDCSAKCEKKYLDDDFRIPNTVCVECMEGKNNKLQMEYHAMLICDDKAGSLKSKIRFYDTRSFNTPDWDCKDGDARTRNAFF